MSQNSLPLEILQADLMQISQIIKLCAFAAEARRTLDEIDKFKLIFKDCGELLSRQIEAANEWREHDDCVGTVLKNVGIQVDNLVQAIGEQ